MRGRLGVSLSTDGGDEAAEAPEQLPARAERLAQLVRPFVRQQAVCGSIVQKHLSLHLLVLNYLHLKLYLAE
jgi:hypothetical protein